MKTLLPSPLIEVFQATRTRLRVLALLALLLALVLPTSGHAVPAGAAARHAFAGGIGIAAHPAGLAAAIARDLGPAAAAGLAAATLPTPLTIQTQILTPAHGAGGDSFGYSVALSGDGNTALVGAPGTEIEGKLEAGAAYLYARSAAGWTRQQVLTASDGSAVSHFGWSVALSGDGTAALVGAPPKAVGGKEYAGAAYVFTPAGDHWRQQTEFTASDGGALNFFGWSVALSGDGTIALVGAFNKTVGGTPAAGAAYVFTHSGNRWVQQTELTAPQGGRSERFGAAVALSGDGTTALVGAYLTTIGVASQEGDAYVFTRAPGNGHWRQQVELTASDGEEFENFGSAVALSGDGTTAMVGATNKMVRNTKGAGVAYVFTRTPGKGDWRQQTELSASDGEADDGFGAAVALSGDGTAALVGAPGRMIKSNAAAGVAYVFTRANERWVQRQMLGATDAAVYGKFGQAVALSGDGTAAMVGALGDTNGTNATTGAAYSYSLPGASAPGTGVATAAATQTETATGTGPAAANAASTVTPPGRPPRPTPPARRLLPGLPPRLPPPSRRRQPPAPARAAPPSRRRRPGPASPRRRRPRSPARAAPPPPTSPRATPAPPPPTAAPRSPRRSASSIPAPRPPPSPSPTTSRAPTPRSPSAGPCPLPRSCGRA